MEERLFIGLPIIPDVAKYLVSVSRDCSRSGGTHSLAEDLHITLKYLGVANRADVIARLKTLCHPSFSVFLGKMGSFPGVLWAGVEDIASNLARLKEKVDSVLSDIKGPDEYDRYRPHISLVFSSGPFDYCPLERKVMRFDSFVLYRLTDDDDETHPQFEELTRFPLCNAMSFLCINDFHAQLDRAAVLTAAVKDFRNQNPGTTVLYGGDNFFYDPVAEATDFAPILGMMKEQAVVFSAVGNHDFELGEKKIRYLEHGGGFRFLCGNVSDSSLFQSYAIVEECGFKLLLVGLMTADQIPSPEMDKGMLGVTVSDPCVALDEVFSKIGSKGFDGLVVLSHLGLKLDANGNPQGMEVGNLCRRFDFLDGIFCGHLHQFVSAEINGVPVLEGGGNGKGFSFLTFYRDDKGKIFKDYGIVKLDDIGYEHSDVEVEQIIRRYSNSVANVMSSRICNIPFDLPARIPATGLIPLHGCALGNLIVNTMRQKFDVDVALFYSGRIGKGFKAGWISKEDFLRTFLFRNRIRICRLRGSDVLEIIETGLRLLEYDNKSPIAEAGLHIRMDYAREYGDRIVESYDDAWRPVDCSRIYSVAVDEFIADGNAGFIVPGYAAQEETGYCIRDMVLRLMEKGIFDESLLSGWIADAVEEEKCR